jgi:phosphomannomutase
MSAKIPCFKAYDIRGRVPDELNEELAGKIGRAYAAHFSPRKIAVCRDMRLSSEGLAAALTEGFLASGVDVVDVGMGGTENAYFAAMHLEAEGVDGAVMITASHNPADYNGMKLVTKGAVPVSGDSGLRDIERLAALGAPATSACRGSLERRDLMPAYLEHLLSYVDVKRLRPFKIVSNPGNGGAGAVIDALEDSLPFSFVKVHHEPDGTFPNGVPNPLLEENRAATADVVRAEGADLGVAWDGDFDRCFFFDETGAFVEGYYMVGLFAEAMLARAPGSAVLFDPRLTWNTLEIAAALGGRPVMSKTGHAFIKERMRKEDAIYGGEMSAHHYFRDFAYCDSGMIPWLLLASVMSDKDKKLSELVAERRARFPTSGEINRQHKDPQKALALVEETYRASAKSEDRTDGLSLEFEGWRFNLRMSNTEPLLRLNVETRGDPALLAEKTAALLALIDAAG